MTALSAFISMLTGKSTVLVADKQMTSYADSTSDAASAQKKLNAELYGFDELTRQGDDSSSSGSGTETSYTWTEVPISEILGEWADLDAYSMGQALGQRLKDALDSIDWDGIKAKATVLGENLANLINGIVETPGLGTSIGKTLAEAINTAFTFLNNFVHTLSWPSIGSFIAEMLNGFFEGIDWPTIYDTFVTGAKGIGEAIWRGIQDFHWDNISETVHWVVMTIADSFIAFVGAIENWREFGQKVGEQIKKILNDKEMWNEAGAALGDGLQAAFDFVKGVLDEVGISDVIGAIKELFSGFFEHFDDEGTLAAILLGALALSIIKTAVKFALLKLAANAIFSGIGAGATTTAASGAASSIIGALSGAFSSLGGIAGIFTTDLGTIIGAGTAAEIALTAFAGAAGAAAASVGGFALGEWINEMITGEEITQSWGEQFSTIKESFTDGSWKSALEMWGDDIYTAFYTLGERQDEALANMKESVSNAWDSIKESTSEKWSNIKESVSEKWNDIKESVSDTLDSTKENISAAWDSVKENTSDKWNSIKLDLSTASDEIKESVSTMVENVKENVSDTWNNIKSDTSTAFENVKSSVTDTWNNLKTNTSTAINNMKSSVQTGWSSMVSSAKTKFSDIYDTVKSKMSSATSHLKGIDWSSIGKDLIAGLLNGLKEKWEKVTSWISSATSSLTSKVKSILGIASPSKVFAKIGAFLDAGLVEGMESGEKEMLATAGELAENLTDRMTGIEGETAFTNDEDISRLDSALTKLEQIADVICNIANALASMGGLEIPQIAAGTVVPYRTSVSDGSTEGSGTEQAGYLGEIARMMQNIIDYLRSGGSSSSGDIRVIIDGREVFNAVVSENERAIQRTGSSPIRV